MSRETAKRQGWRLWLKQPGTLLPEHEPMNCNIRSLYSRERSLGFQAHAALRNAGIRHRWEDMQARSVVALRVVPDDSPDLSWADEKTLERAGRDGVWGLVAEYHCPRCYSWVVADSVWGFIGEDWRDSGYDTDLMASAMEAYAAQEECGK